MFRRASWNWFSQLYIAFAGIVIIPVYIKHFGAEVYGLIAFMLTLQMLMSLLDVGFSASLSRETSRYRAQATDSLFFHSFLSIVLKVFLFAGVIIAAAIFFAASFLATQWLDVNMLDIEVVTYLLQVTAGIIFLRWLAIYFRSVIFGYEDIIWLAKFTTVVATLRFVAVVPLILYWEIDVEIYFYHQFAVQLFELTVLVFRKRKIIPPVANMKFIAVSDASFKAPIRFTLAAGGATILWLLISQADKFFASTFLSLADYGYFHVAVMAAGMITLITAPLVQVMQPRVTTLLATGNHDAAISIVKGLFDFMAVIALCTVLIVYVFGFSLLTAWYGEPGFAERTFNVFLVYSMATATLAVNSCSFIIDYASGKIRLRNYCSLVMLVTLLIAYPITFYYFSAMGAAFTWLIINIAYFIIAQPLLLAQHDKAVYSGVVRNTILPRMALCAALVLLFYAFDLPERLLDVAGRATIFLLAGFSWLILIVIFLLAKTEPRALLLNKISGFYERT
ncbi:lipopolysaccharide biosynthesis protein [Arsukibacterium indicum]|uniref:Oligosaccharide flippase family protein n=1 Tax=Arsukibacterium indicum TaxID=2848612 RepID=A0ABS6MG52_9GAMM|nr:oligosaccharide flippase family protein [Arsukibacterium indicum]MBV2127806.1 oligosaccharide flippase family protein [Arsukibacterium indicum]